MSNAMQALEEIAVDAVRLGRRLAAEWPDVAVDCTAQQQALLAPTLARLSAGEVFATSDDHPMDVMLEAVRETLDGYREGYGNYFLRESTSEAPFYDIEQDRVRRLGEVLKSFRNVRYEVLDRITAERQLIALRRR